MWRYTMNAHRCAEELAAEARAAHEHAATSVEETLQERFAEMTYGDWIAWREAHREAVEKLVRATPSARERRKRKPDLLAYLAAHQWCRQAAVLIEGAEQIRPGPGYRLMAAHAGAQAHEIAHAVIAIEMEDFNEERLKFKRR